MATHKKYTLEENLALTNQELKSNNSRLASLISSFQKLSWSECQKKAIELLKDNEADDYIDHVRMLYDNGMFAFEHITGDTPFHKSKPSSVSQSTGNIESKNTPLFRKNSSVYERNYKLLLEVAPGLEQKLLNYKGQTIYGKSKSETYMDLNFELLYIHGGQFHFAMSQNYIQNGDLVPDPDMEILIDPKGRYIEALHFQDYRVYKTVYEDPINRQKVNLKEKKSQNDFLNSWLKNLKDQGHSIVWRKENDSNEDYQVTNNDTESIIEDTYKDSHHKNNLPKTTASKPTDNTEKKSSKNDKMNLSKDQMKELAMIVANYQESTIEKATKAISKAIEENTLTEYLLQGCTNLFNQGQTIRLHMDFYRINYLLPDFISKLKVEGTTATLIPSKKSLPIYSVVFAQNLRGKSILIAIYEQTLESTEGTMLLRINAFTRTATIDFLSGNFFGEEDHFDVSDKITEADANYLFNFLTKWVDHLIDNRYAVNWDEPTKETPLVSQDVVPSNQSVNSATPETEKLKEPEQEDPHAINDEIPDFEPGQVQLTAAHIKRGVTQEVIDRINETQEGVTIFPRKDKMINLTKSPEMDKLHFALKPGFRLSRTGKFYYEGRSNRADKSSKGI